VIGTPAAAGYLTRGTHGDDRMVLYGPVRNDTAPGRAGSAPAPLIGAAGAPALPGAGGRAFRWAAGRAPASRRVLLAGLAGGVLTGTLAGCRIGGSPKATPPTGPHPLAAITAGTVALVGSYQAAVAGQPALAYKIQPILDDHLADLAALRGAMGQSSPSAGAASGASSPSVGTQTSPADALAALRTFERSAQAEAVTACLAASAQYAALLGSIAACRATHVEVLA